MFEQKSIFRSKTFWGGITAILAPLLGMVGYSVTPADMAEIVTLVTAILSAGGGILAIFGRIKATKRIG